MPKTGGGADAHEPDSWSVVDHGDGTYQATFTCERAGEFVLCAGVLVGRKAVWMKACVAEGEGPSRAIAKTIVGSR